MKFKNYKININELQPLDEILKELERLGYKRNHISPRANIVYTENGTYFVGTQIGDNELYALNGYIETTLDELKKETGIHESSLNDFDHNDKLAFEEYFRTTKTYENMILDIASNQLSTSVFDKKGKKYRNHIVQIAYETFKHQQAKINEKEKLIALATTKWSSVISMMATMDMIIVPDEVHQKLDELGDILKGITP